MPTWAGTWKGGRYYLDEQGRPVFFIERRRRSVKLQTHDPELALGDLARFLRDPVEFCRPPPVPVDTSPVHVTPERLNLYMQHIRKTCEDHRKARRSYLLAWANYRDSRGAAIDLRTADKKTLRAALASFMGGHRGRVEALNAFANFLVEERDQGLQSWARFANPYDTKPTRAARQAYTVDELRDRYNALTDQRMRDLLLVRVATGLHQTEIDQLDGAKVTTGLLPDAKVAAIRTLDGKHEIRGVVQVFHKNQHRHRVSVTAPVLEAVLRLREGVPYRVSVWKALDPIVPSNLRHTYETLAEDCGRVVTHESTGVARALVAQTMGHRAGSTMVADRYNQSQIPPMVVIPLDFP